MQPEDFITAYETALATQKWTAVAPLIHEDACVTFSSGAVHRGKDAVRRAFEANFAATKKAAPAPPRNLKRAPASSAFRNNRSGRDAQRS